MAEDRVVIAFPGREAYGQEMSDTFYRADPAARRVFEQANELFHQDFRRLCYGGAPGNGPLAGIALAVHCYAAYSVLRQRCPEPVGYVGYSQGEFLACAAAGVIAYPSVLGILERLERLLQRHCDPDEGLFRVLELERSALEACCAGASSAGYVGIGAYIADDQHVLAGQQPALRQAARLAKQRGARWVLPLPARRGFHSPLCDEVQQQAAPYFENRTLQEPIRPVYSCVDGQASRDAQTIWGKLSRQINHPLRWDRVVRSLNAAGVTRLVEVGPGCTVSSNTRIAGSRFACTWLHTIKDCEAL